jgi:hypothetical protein
LGKGDGGVSIVSAGHGEDDCPYLWGTFLNHIAAVVVVQKEKALHKPSHVRKLFLEARMRLTLPLRFPEK